MKKLFILSFLALFVATHSFAGIFQDFKDAHILPSNNDPRVLAIIGLGIVTAGCGFIMLKNGMETFHQSSNTAWQMIKNKLSGFTSTTVGTGITAVGLGVMYFSKNIVQEIAKFNFNNALESWRK